MLAQQAWTVRTEVFDGPLDLLLYLVRRDGIDLRKLSIVRIADAYLDYLERMREVNLGVAAEYLVMAATLCHLKSRELLPRPPTLAQADEEEQDPREALVKRLIDHQRFREAAEALEGRPQVGREVFVREPLDEPEGPPPLRTPVDAFGLLELYHGLLKRQDAASAVYELSDSGPDIGACCGRVLQWLGGPGGTGELGEVLAGMQSRIERVLTFLGVLEMARIGWLEVEQQEHLGPVHLTSRVEASQDLEAVVGRVELAAS